MGALPYEREIEDYLWERPELFGPYFKWIGRQVTVQSGRIDLLGYEPQGTVVVVELKRDVCNLKAAAQALGYLNDVQSVLWRSPVRRSTHYSALLVSYRLTARAEEFVRKFSMLSWYRLTENWKLDKTLEREIAVEYMTAYSKALKDGHPCDRKWVEDVVSLDLEASAGAAKSMSELTGDPFEVCLIEERLRDPMEEVRQKAVEQGSWR